jgi:hypothetical protein
MAQIGREIRNCLNELRQLRKDALLRADEPEEALENEPKSPLPANDDAAARAISVTSDAMVRNEPDAPGVPPRNEPDRQPADALWLVEGVPVLDAWGHPRRPPAAVP